MTLELARVDPVEHEALRSELEALRVRASIAPMTISHAVDLWLGELVRRNHAETTVATYRRLLDELADHYPHIDVDEVTTEHIRRFLDAAAKRRDGKRKAASTIAQNVSIVYCFFKWLTAEAIVRRNPTERNGMPIISRPKQIRPEENDNVVTVTTGDVARMLEVADRSKWNRRLAVYALALTGPRRHALAQARLSDYDREARTLTFHEKGGKTICKPVPHMLADVLDAAIAAGVYQDEADYLILGDALQRRAGERDDRIILRLVREVAADAGVDCHVHALRAAFAVAFLEQKPGELVPLMDLMGHSQLDTTRIYLRRLDRRRSMETIRDFAWPGNDPTPTATANSEELFEALPVTEKEGFEPSFDAEPHGSGAGLEPEAVAPLDQALREQIRPATELAAEERL